MTRASRPGLALAALLTLAMATPSFAQGVGVGIKGGPLFADFSSDDLDFDNRTGWQAGIFLGGNRQGPFGVMTEINYIEKKVTFLVPPGSGSGLPDQKISISYIQIPIFLRVNAATQSKNGFAFYLIAGPSFDAKISEDLGDIDIDDGFAGIDIGLIGGAGIEISRIILEGRYTWGFRAINKDFTDTADIKTRSFAILLGLRFN